MLFHQRLLRSTMALSLMLMAALITSNARAQNQPPKPVEELLNVSQLIRNDLKQVPFNKSAKLSMDQVKSIFKEAGYGDKWDSGGIEKLDTNENPVNTGLGRVHTLKSESITYSIVTFKNLKDREKFGAWISESDTDIFNVIHDQGTMLISISEVINEDDIVNYANVLWRRIGHTQIYDAVMKKDLTSFQRTIKGTPNWKDLRFTCAAFTDLPFESSHYYSAPLENFVALHGTVEMMNFLLDNGGSVDHLGHLHFGYAAENEDIFNRVANYGILFGALYNSPEMVKLLVDKGTDVNNADTTGWAVAHELITTLSDKETNESPDAWVIIEYLMSKGMNLRAKTRYNESPLNFVESDDAVKYLVSKGIKPEIDIHGNTPLHFTVTAELIKVCKQHNININRKNNHGDTALHNAWDAEDAELLIKAGADMTIKNSDGMTPADIAEELGDEEMIELFESLKK